MEKITVICTKTLSSNPTGEYPINVDSRMYDSKMEPIMGKYKFQEGMYHLGQKSSSFSWAKQDISTRYSEYLDPLFPEGYYFEFKLIDNTSETKHKFKEGDVLKLQRNGIDLLNNKPYEVIYIKIHNLTEGGYEWSYPQISHKNIFNSKNSNDAFFERGWQKISDYEEEILGFN